MLRRQVGGIHTKLLVIVPLLMAAAALCSAVTSEAYLKYLGSELRTSVCTDRPTSIATPNVERKPVTQPARMTAINHQIRREARKSQAVSESFAVS
jgi:hypothetical protein